MPPTYRLLSSTAVTNPLRVIAHCDIDAAYAQFEQVRLGLPDDIPLICAQWQSIIAVNYPARAFGIKRFNTIDEAKKMCPDLYVQHVATYKNGETEAGYWDEVDSRTHKVSLDPYRRESLKILAIFKETVSGDIEKASIDEAFIDLTSMACDRLVKMHSLDGPPDAPLPPAPRIPWTGNVIPVEDENHEDGWEDWALFVGGEIMSELRAKVYEQLHYTCSAGIAHGKASAKLCSAWKKPNNQTILRAAATPAFLRDMDFTEIRFLGGKLGTAISTEFGVKTVGDLLSISLEDLQKRFGEEAVWVYNVIRGIDHSEVTPRLATKSMLASKNTRPAVTNPEQGMHWLRILSGELLVRLKEARELSPSLWPRTLVLGHRTGIESAKHRQTPFPFSRNLDVEYILRHAKRLWEEVCQPMSKGGMKLNNISLSFSGLDKGEQGQRGIEGFFAGAPAGGRNAARSIQGESVLLEGDSPAASEAAAAAPRARTRLPTLRKTEKRKPLDGFFGPAVKRQAADKKGESSTATHNANAGVPSVSTEQDHVVLSDDDEDDAGTVQERGSHSSRGSAARSKRPSSSGEQTYDAIANPGGQSGEGLAQSLSSSKCARCSATVVDTASARQEHEDYHFALDLSNGVEGDPRGGAGGASSAATARQAKTGGEGGTGRRQGTAKAKAGGARGGGAGIKAFFAPLTKGDKGTRR